MLPFAKPGTWSASIRCIARGSRQCQSRWTSANFLAVGRGFTSAKNRESKCQLELEIVKGSRAQRLTASIRKHGLAEEYRQRRKSRATEQFW